MQQENYYIKNPIVKAAMRILSWILLFLGAFSMAQAVMIFVNEVNLGQVSIPVVIVFLFLTPFMLLAAWFAAFGVHKTVQGQNGGSSLVLAYAMLILASVDNLVYIPIHYGADTATSFFILGGIELVAVVLLFCILLISNVLLFWHVFSGNGGQGYGVVCLRYAGVEFWPGTDRCPALHIGSGPGSVCDL